MTTTTATPGRSLAVTIGEPAGIGPDIALAAWHQRRERALLPFYLIADAPGVSA
jgi:4-hydroxythreonine-4-phosphate dehydrogenase